MATVSLTDKTFDDAIRNATVVIDFWAGWCSPCLLFGPIFERVSEHHPDVVFAKVDVDENPRLAARFDIRSIPTLVAIREGSTVLRRSGALSGRDLNQLVGDLAGDDGALRDPADTQVA
jgi:thioredoxin 1